MARFCSCWAGGTNMAVVGGHRGLYPGAVETVRRAGWQAARPSALRSPRLLQVVPRSDPRATETASARSARR
ncbi:MAG: hypothetical protein LBE67_07235 [Kocuria palustris]|nr:hypothetical protein [Kocuria palustris]